MYQTDKCVVAQVLKVVVIINLIIIDHSRMIQAFRIIEISKYDDGGQLTTRGQLMQGSSTASRHKLATVISWPPSPNLEITNLKADCNRKWSIIITFMLCIRFKHCTKTYLSVWPN